MSSASPDLAVVGCASCEPSTPFALHIGAMPASLVFDVAAAVASMRTAAARTAGASTSDVVSHDVCFAKAVVTVDGNDWPVPMASIQKHVITPLLGIARCAAVRALTNTKPSKVFGVPDRDLFVRAFNATLPRASLYKSSYHFLSLFTDDLGLSSRYVLHIDADVRLIGVPQPLGTSGTAVPSAASAWPSVGTRGAVERSPLAQALTMVATQLSHHVAISIVPRCDRACLILEPRCMDDSRRSRALLRSNDARLPLRQLERMRREEKRLGAVINVSAALESEQLVGAELELVCPRPACMCSPRRSHPTGAELELIAIDVGAMRSALVARHACAHHDAPTPQVRCARLWWRGRYRSRAPRATSKCSSTSGCSIRRVRRRMVPETARRGLSGTRDTPTMTPTMTPTTTPTTSQRYGLLTCRRRCRCAACPLGWTRRSFCAAGAGSRVRGAHGRSGKVTVGVRLWSTSCREAAGTQVATRSPALHGPPDAQGSSKSCRRSSTGIPWCEYGIAQASSTGAPL